jgi:ribonuclease G
MLREIIVNADPGETRIAMLEDKELVELMVERSDRRRTVGDIYKGRVTAVLPGMQAAFVDLGLAKTAFLHVSDLAGSMAALDEDLEDQEQANGRRLMRIEKIEEYLQKGQEILVEVTKEPIGTKGPRVTAQISLPGRFCVLLPGVDHIGVSRKIEDRAERQRLKWLAQEFKPRGAGVIVRTVGEGAGRKQLEEDITHLAAQWEKIERRAARAPAPSLLHKEMAMTTGVLRDLFNEDVHQLVIDDPDEYKRILEYLKTAAPELRSRVKLYRGDVAIFDAYQIEPEIEKTLERKVWLKRGGYIVIDHTEALVSIDVNTGRYTGKKNQEETILRTNLEAAKEIARQLRLRDIGGIIVIDFIDMEIEANKRAVLELLRTQLKRDRSKTKTFNVSDLGLVEMTRQRERPSLYHYYSDDCSECGGIGKVPSLSSARMKVERALHRLGISGHERSVELRMHPKVAVHLLEEAGQRLAELERRYGLNIEIRDDPTLRRDQIRVLSQRTKEDLTALSTVRTS